MLEKVTLPGVDLPRLYLARSEEDVRVAMSCGVPFVRYDGSMRQFLRCLLRPMLEERFPSIIWDKVLGKRREVRSKVVLADVEDDRAEPREAEARVPEQEPGVYEHGVVIKEDDGTYVPTTWACPDAATQLGSTRSIDILDYCGDLSSAVNVEVLQSLRLLPSFMGDIVDCIKLNNQAVLWTEGYDKKRRQALGRFDRSRQLRNLIILDVSVSIPRGIAATMTQLVDTLRYQTSADLLITGGDSGFYRHGEALPDPTEMYRMYGGCNESDRFLEVMRKNVVGREWGHVIAFGDYNYPNLRKRSFSWAGTKVREAHHYHTVSCFEPVGYAEWTQHLDELPEKEHFDNTWCKVIAK